jgi:hypothetical protein
MPDTPFTQEVFRFLDSLRESGKVNMFGAPQVLQQAFGFDRKTATEFFTAWTRTFQ